MRDPEPDWPEYRDDRRLRVTRWNVDDEPSDLILADSFQIFADSVDVPAVNIDPSRVQDRPRLLDERLQGLFRLLLRRLKLGAL